jgi:hypothetical protein
MSMHPHVRSWIVLASLTAAVAAAAAAPLAAQQPTAAAKPGDKAKPTMTMDTTKSKTDSARAATAAAGLPEGYRARTDRGAPLTSVKVATMAPGVHVTTGPATILWREQDRVNGRFHTLATFHQTKKPAHPEAYGMFFGGDALNGEGQKYTYFLVRGDGKFLIKRRDGAGTTNVTPDWTAHPAIKQQDAEGKATNKLEIDAKASSDKVRFSVNGQTVHEMDQKDAELNGIVGLRVNHNLDLHVEGFDIHRL